MTLRTRVIAAVVVIALVLSGVLAVVARTTRDNLVAQVDEQLDDASASIGRMPTDGPGPGGDDGPPDDPRQPLSPLYVGVVDGDEVVTLVAPGLRDLDVPLPALDADEVVAASEAEEAFTVASESSDLRWRVVAEVDPEERVTVIGLPLDSVDATLDDLIRLELAAAAVIFVALALVAVWVIRLGVRPVQQMTDVATAIADGDLSQRVPETSPGTEAGELGVALNKMLTSIEASFDERARSEERMRRFVADASHELRTPLATIRGYAELYRSGALDGDAEVSDAMRRTEMESIRMGALVEDLLALARFDEGRPPTAGPVDIGSVVADAAADARAVDPGREVSVEVDGGVVVEGDEARIRQVVTNLVGNVLVHTPTSAPLALSAGRTGAIAWIEVADAGPGMEPEVAAKAFERFFRADPARSRHHGGSGLGLSIVEAAVGAHGGTVSLDSEVGRGTTVRVELPADGWR